MLDVQFVPDARRVCGRNLPNLQLLCSEYDRIIYQHEISFEEMHDLLFYANPRFQSFAIFTSDLETLIGYIGLKQYSVRESVTILPQKYLLISVMILSTKALGHVHLNLLNLSPRNSDSMCQLLLLAAKMERVFTHVNKGV